MLSTSSHAKQKINKRILSDCFFDVLQTAANSSVMCHRTANRDIL